MYARKTSSWHDLTEQAYAAMPFVRLLGVERIEGTADAVRGRIIWDATRCTSGGVLHGAVLMGLADALGGLVAFLNLPDGATATATIESKANFFGPVREGFVEGMARPIHVGRRTIVVDTDLLRSGGDRVARVTQTQAVL